MGNATENWISDEEISLVEQLKENVKDELSTEFFSKSEEDQRAFLVKWIRARNLNLQKAQDMLLKALKWRNENKLDTVFDHGADPFIVDLCRWNFVGIDKKGRPVAVCPISDWDLRKIVSNNKIDEFDFFVKQYFESIGKEIEIKNKEREIGQPPVTQFFGIFDLSGFPYGQMLSMSAMKKLLLMASLYEAYYPEAVYKIVLLNCPWFYSMLLNFGKPFLSQGTLNKMMAYSNLDDWQKDVKNYMDPSILPVHYGGTNTEVLSTSEQTKYLQLCNE